jgi:CheY-like chemotaxis protein
VVPPLPNTLAVSLMSLPIDTDDLADQLRVEFRDDAQDRLALIYQTLDKRAENKLTDEEALILLRREASKLRGIGSSCGFPLVNLIAHRLETYLSGNLTRLNERQIEDVMAFADRLSVAVDREERPDVATTNQIIRTLPVRYEFDITDIEVHDVEIMLVTPSKVVSKLVSTELGACGFRTVVVRDPIESIALAVRMPPDMIIASAVMDGLGGMDLLRGLKAMTPTHKVPMALLTSLDSVVKDVPEGIMVIRVGANFGDDFAAAITKFNLG